MHWRKIRPADRRDDKNHEDATLCSYASFSMMEVSDAREPVVEHEIGSVARPI